MAMTLFDCPLFVQRKRYIEEIATLEDAFDLLEAWPADERGLAHEVVMDACQQAHAGKFPLDAFRTNLGRFLKRANLLADVPDMPDVSCRTDRRLISRSLIMLPSRGKGDEASSRAAI